MPACVFRRWETQCKRKSDLSDCSRTNRCSWRAHAECFSNAKIIRDFLYRIESGELANAHAHGIARMDQAIGARHDAAISAVGVSGRPVAGAVNFTGLNWAIANRRTRQ